MAKTVLITGCSSGIGAATAKVFEHAGWNVVATMRKPDRGVVAQRAGSRLTLPLDVTIEVSVKAAVSATLEAFGSIDVVVNNAGFGLYGPFETAAPELIARQFDTNVTGVFNVTRAVLPAMRQQAGGVIVNVASVGGFATFPMHSLYYATKFAVVGFSEALNFELSPFGIRVKVIAPGGVETDFASRSLVRTYGDDGGPYAQTLAELETSAAARVDVFGSAASVGESILIAATDGTAKTRYIVGADAQAMLEMRASVSDEKYMDNVRQYFGLTR
jgi:NAD(P)-dependent dehydrogenase (short-subunit alcohol dehydrogenase family)